MSSEWITESRTLLSSSRFGNAKAELLNAIQESSKRINTLKPSPTGEVRASYLKAVQEFNQLRGRDLYYPFIASGLGCGPLVELLDGSIKFDMITGIGINFFGHSHPALMAEIIDSLSSDIMQGNLEPGYEAKDLLQTLLSRVGNESKLSHGWLTTCGTMANEVALKIIRQRKSPATKILAFEDCFAGRSTAMQEITDNPKYREGQPVYGEVYYLPFYNSKLGIEPSIEATLRVMQSHLTRFSGKFAALMIELIQGEGGFYYAPHEFYIRVFEAAKKAGLAIWVDEVQTFGRTGELFAYQKFDLSKYVDVVTIGKMLQACAVLYAAEYNPKSGLVAGTFSGNSGVLRAAKKIVEMLCQDGLLGEKGKIVKLSDQFAKNLKRMAETGRTQGMVGECRNIGGMIAFSPFSGSLEDVKTVLMKLFDLGVVAFYCGHGPYFVRLLPPLGVMTESHVDEVCSIVEEALVQVAMAKREST